LTLAVNLLPVSATQVFNFQPMLLTGVALFVANIFANFGKKSKCRYWNYKGASGKGFMEKSCSQKSHDTVPVMYLKRLTETAGGV
jgi:hypothetical protein